MLPFPSAPILCRPICLTAGGVRCGLWCVGVLLLSVRVLCVGVLCWTWLLCNYCRMLLQQLLCFTFFFLHLLMSLLGRFLFPLILLKLFTLLHYVDTAPLIFSIMPWVVEVGVEDVGASSVGYLYFIGYVTTLFNHLIGSPPLWPEFWTALW